MTDTLLLVVHFEGEEKPHYRTITELVRIGRFDLRIVISPGHLFRVREEQRACPLEYPGSDFSTGPLTRLPTSIWSTKAA